MWRSFIVILFETAPKLHLLVRLIIDDRMQDNILQTLFTHLPPHLRVCSVFDSFCRSVKSRSGGTSFFFYTHGFLMICNAIPYFISNFPICILSF